jgi:hypothetical protein
LASALACESASSPSNVRRSSQAFGLTVGFVGCGVLGWCALALIVGFGGRLSTPV